MRLQASKNQINQEVYRNQREKVTGIDLENRESLAVLREFESVARSC